MPRTIRSLLDTYYRGLEHGFRSYYRGLEHGFRSSYNEFVWKVHRSEVVKSDLYPVVPTGLAVGRLLWPLVRWLLST